MNHSIRLLFFILVGGLLGFAGCKSDKTPSGESSDHGHEEHSRGEDNHEKGESYQEALHLTTGQIRTAEIQLVKALRKLMRIEVEVLGEIASDTDRVVQVRPDLPGTVQEVLVTVGDTVEPGEALIRYLSEASPVQTKELKATTRGVVVGLYAQPGGHIVPAVPLVTLADISKLRCGLDVYEKDIGRVRKGQRVRIKVAAFPNEIFESKITYISPRVDENSRTIKVRVDVTNPKGKLKFGMFVQGHIQVGHRQALVVPKAAIQKVKGKPTVFVAKKEGMFIPREVQLGESFGSLVEVNAGIKVGETVVAQGSFILKSELEKESFEAGHAGH